MDWLLWLAILCLVLGAVRFVVESRASARRRREMQQEKQEIVREMAALACPHCNSRFGAQAIESAWHDGEERFGQWPGQGPGMGRRFQLDSWEHAWWFIECPSCGWRSEFHVGSDLQPERTVRNCDFGAQRDACSRDWRALQATAQPDVRWCLSCEREVFFCATDAETIFHAERGARVAREARFCRPPSKEDAKEDAQEQASQDDERERHIDDALSDLKHTARRCPRCAYPFPEWRKTCRVCGHVELRRKPAAG